MIFLYVLENIRKPLVSNVLRGMKRKHGPEIGYVQEFFVALVFWISTRRLLVFTYIYQLQEVSLISEYYMHWYSQTLT